MNGDGDSIRAQVLVKLGNIEGKLDSAIKQFDEHLKMDERVHNNMYDRLSLLERWKARIIGITVGVGAIAGAIGSWLHKSGGS